MYFISAALNQTGGRNHNEDSWGEEQLEQQANCWVVADGLGGHRGGEVASQLAVERILAAFRQNCTLAPQTLLNYLETAQTAILARQQQQAQFAEMRTTLVILLTDYRAVLWAHVGDSRLYHFRDNRLVFQTQDHSVPQALVDAGEIPYETIRRHQGRNRLLRSLGNPAKFLPVIAEQPLSLKAGDAFLLCTDGFWDHVLEREMETDLAKSSTPEQWLTRMLVSRLLVRVPAKHDNYSAVAVFVAPSLPRLTPKNDMVSEP